MSYTDIAVAVEGVGNLAAVVFIGRYVLPATIRHKVYELVAVFTVLWLWFATNVWYAFAYADRTREWSTGWGYDTVLDDIVEGVQRATMYALPIVILLASYGLLKDRRNHD